MVHASADSVLPGADSVRPGDGVVQSSCCERLPPAGLGLFQDDRP
jgi:hypothetical protein